MKKCKCHLIMNKTNQVKFKKQLKSLISLTPDFYGLIISCQFVQMKTSLILSIKILTVKLYHNHLTLTISKSPKVSIYSLLN